MPEIRLAVAHNLDQKEAFSRIQRFIGEMKEEHGDRIQNLQENWNENGGVLSFRAEGFSTSVILTVHNKNVELSMEIPSIAVLFKSRIEQEIRERFNELFD